MTRRDIDRYLRKASGIMTEADRDAQRNEDIRYRVEPAPDPGIYPLGIELVTGHLAANTSTTQATVSNTTYARYIGRAVPRLQEVQVLYQVTTAAATITWAELALAYSPEPELLPTAALDIYAIATLDIATRVNTTGRKRSDIVDIGEVNAGLHLWVLIGANATTPMSLRGGLPDNMGLQLERAAYRPGAAINEPREFSATATSFNDFWMGIKQVQA